MKVIYSILITGIFLILGISCERNCVESENMICKEVPPTNEVCLAYFERWFYNEETDQCEKIAYSGCSQLGFEIEEECLTCKCTK